MSGTRGADSRSWVAHAEAYRAANQSDPSDHDQAQEHEANVSELMIDDD